MNSFLYYKKQLEIKPEENSILFSIPPNTSDKKTILALYADRLKFPEYFGWNWDALLDCLRDLSFLNKKIIIIFHEDIPFNNDEESKHIYIEILFDTLRHWLEFPEHKFYIYFPDTCKAEITKITEALGYQ